MKLTPRALAFLTLLAGSTSCLTAAAETGLLFYLSGENGTTADVSSGGTPEPTVVRGVDVIADGAKGSAFQCANSQLMAFWAPGNIYAQRGTLSLYWRSRDPVGPTEFPVFRVAYADHSSWDMVWLRIDYNGHGFDAFVTDASLSRTRVSVTLDPFPKPTEWTHLAISWDETRGIRFYVNGKLAAKNETTAVYNTGLDQFGPHSRVISPNQVQSGYNFVRGGDMDELRIYDRMLSDENIATLAKGDAVTDLGPLAARTLTESRFRDEWWLRYGWNAANVPPPYLGGNAVSVRKVEILEAYDIKRWWWKGLDGIRETTWPGVYNRSRLTGRNDYFQLPDWDCYADSGKAITFTMPSEPWNQIEISGAAWGKMELLQNNSVNAGPVDAVLFERPQGQEKTINRLAAPLTGRKIRFTNVEQEQPIGELTAYNVTSGREPAGSAKLAYRIAAVTPDASLGGIVDFVNRRHPADERAMLVAQPVNAPAPAAARAALAPGLPIVHVLIPDNWDQIDGGLDGIAIDLPALPVQPTHGPLFPLNLQVKDANWLYRNALDFTFSVRPGEAKTLWLDLRDRIMPVGKSFYLTIAGAGADFNAAMLEGAQIRLVFKPRAAALAEHEIDRFTQARDVYGMMAEEHPRNSRLNLWNRFSGDLSELMRVNPNHNPGIYYYAAAGMAPTPPTKFGTPPAGVPLWAYRQVELLERYKRFALWYIDNRQSDFGDFGGGLPDDNDLSNIFPALAFMGADPEKFSASLYRILEATYNNGMFTNGVNTIQTDDLHSFEEGTTALAQNLMLHYGSPRQLERAMESERGMESLTGINVAGHRHIMSSYFSATKIAREDPWGWVRPNNYMMLQPSELLVEFNGSPKALKFLVDIADGVLAHRKVDPATGRASMPSTIRFNDDAEGGAGGGGAGGPISYLFWTTWIGTGQRKYLEPVLDAGLQAVNANLLDIFDLRKNYTATGALRGGPVAQAPEFGAPVSISDDPANAGRGGGRGGRGGRGGGGGRGFAGAAAGGPAGADVAGGRGAAGGRGGGGGGGGRNRNGGDSLLWQLTGDKQHLVTMYNASLDDFDSHEYLYTEGGFWIDRVFAESSRTSQLQKTRLGGIVHSRNDLLPGHVVSWKFHAPANEQSVAFLIPNATPTGFKVIAYNLQTVPVKVTMTGWNIDPGIWDITQGIDANEDDVADGATETRTIKFEKTESTDVTLAPRVATILTLKLKTPGKPYWERPDVGIDRADVEVMGDTIKLTVHSLGSVDAPATSASVLDRAGKVLVTVPVPPLKAPLDLQPKTTTVMLKIPAGGQMGGGSVVLDADAKVQEITRYNNRVNLGN